MSDFDSLGVAPTLTKALSRAQIVLPTPIQQQAIPLALQGHDILGLAQTGTGKTLAFGLPMIDRLLAAPERPAPKSVKALILAPTRELVNQIAENLRPLVHNTPVRVTTVVGGQSIHRQIQTLARGVDILVATPGRLIDLMERGSVQLSTVRFLVLDEADQMLDLGFIQPLRRIASQLGTPRQTMMFSATMPKQLEELSRSYLTNPRRVEVAPPGKTVDKVEQIMLFTEKSEKPTRLREILSRDLDALTLVFSRTKHGAEKLMKQLVADGYNAASIHGNKSQGQRDRAIKAFRDGTVTVLVATDVAARGIDIPGVAYVINYDLPNVPEAYVHRIGRTARAGRGGTAISFCGADEMDMLRDIEKLVGRHFGSHPEAVAAPPRRKSRPARANDAHSPAKKPKQRRARRSKGAKGAGAPESARKTGKDTSRSGLSRMLGKGGSRRSHSAA